MASLTRYTYTHRSNFETHTHIHMTPIHSGSQFCRWISDEMQRALPIEEMGRWARKELCLLCTPFEETFEKTQWRTETQWRKVEPSSDEMQRVVVIEEMGRWERKELGPETHRKILSSLCTNYTAKYIISSCHHGASSRKILHSNPRIQHPRSIHPKVRPRILE